MKKFQALAFDIDGTLTEFGSWSIHPDLPPILNQLPMELELALCSGRTLQRQVERLEEILKDAPDKELQKQRWTLITDNGSAAYRWNRNSKEWEALFETEWGGNLPSKKWLAHRIRRLFFYLLRVELRHFTVVVLLPAFCYAWPKKVKKWANLIQKRLEQFWKTQNFAHQLNVESSGLGSLIFPKSVGKGRAVQRFADIKKIPINKVACFGDSPEGNDHELLSGHYGQAFVVHGPQETAQILSGMKH